MPSRDNLRGQLPVATFAAPERFGQDEATTVWGPRVDPTLRDPRALQKQVASRPTFVSQTRRLDRAASLEKVVAESIRDLIDNLPGLAPIVPSAVTFTDGARGLLLEIAFPLEPGFDVAQLQVARLDGDIFTTLTFSIERSGMTAKVRAERLEQLLTLTVTP